MPVLTVCKTGGVRRQNVLVTEACLICHNARSRDRHRLCTYLFDLAQAFTAFYEACPVLKDGHEATRESRLFLCAATARVLAQGLGLLGIDAPERM